MADWLKQRKKTAPKRPDVIVLYSIEGGGKTSFGAQFPGACFAMTEGETGLLKLLERGLVPEVEYFPEWKTWGDVVECTAELIASSERPRTFVVDCVNGAEQLLVDHVCLTRYDGQFDKKGFLNFQEGWDTMLPDWRRWIGQLDRLRNLGTTIVLLAHAKTINHKNPEGTDYHRHVAKLHEKMWASVREFADLICFLNFHTETDGKKGKGGKTRIYHFERSAAFDAKQRHGLPASMMGKGSSVEDFRGFAELVRASGPKKPTGKPKKTEEPKTEEPESVPTTTTPEAEAVA